MLSEQQVAFLLEQRVARLATADATGRPHVLPVCFTATRSDVYITVDEKPKRDPRRPLERIRNIRENPHVALVADVWDEDWSRLAWVMVRGVARVLATGAEHDAAQERLRERYAQYRSMDLAPHPVIAIRVAHVAEWRAAG